MHIPDDVSLCEMNVHSTTLIALSPNFTKILSKHSDSHSSPVLPKHEKFGLQFRSGFVLMLGHCELYNRITKSRN